MGKNTPESGLNDELASVQAANLTGDAKYYTGIDWMSLLFRLLENIHWILIAAIVSGVAMGVYVKLTVKPVYQATSKIYIAGSETTISLADLQLGSSLAKDYQEVFKIWHVHELVDERLDLNYSYSKLAGMVSVSNPDGSHLLYIKVKSTDPQEAKMLADTYAEVVQDFIANKMELRKPQLLEIAQVPTRPISPNIQSEVIKSFVLGGLVVAGIVIFLYLLDDKIKTSEDIEKSTGLATLGILPRLDEKQVNAVSQDVFKYPEGMHIAQIRTDLSLDYAGDESINTICSAIMFTGKNMKRVAVTSHDANNGKSFLTIHIAYSMAKRGKKVLLIDCDLRKSVLLQRYRITHTDKGLAHFLSGQCSLKEAIYPTNHPNLFLLPVGETVKTPLSLLTSPEFEQLMEYAGENFDLVLMDTPPVGMVIDAAEIAKSSDGSILVLEYNKQSKNALRYMQKTMEQTQTPIIGCVINSVAVKSLYQKRLYYRYGAGYMSYGGYSYGSYGNEGNKKEKSRKVFSFLGRRKK